MGHSERRQFFGETDATVDKKIEAVLANGLNCIACVGETLAEREAGQTFAVLERQVRNGLSRHLTSARLVIAYEPVWAIGTGKTATPVQAQEAHAFIRQVVAEAASPAAAQAVRILYGGSVKPDNIATLMAQPDVDGGLVGGASLDAAPSPRSSDSEDSGGRFARPVCRGRGGCMFIALAIVHVVIAFGLILVVLLQSGKGRTSGPLSAVDRARPSLAGGAQPRSCRS